MTTPRTEALLWRAMYASGETIESIALDVGHSTGTVRTALHRVDTPMRPAHQRAGVPQKPSPATAGDSAGTGLRAVRLNPTRGHRRRGRL